MPMHPSTKVLLIVVAVSAGSYGLWRIQDYRRAKEFRARRLAKEARERAEREAAAS